MPDFSDRLNRLPPYLFTRITQLKKEAYAKKLDVIDLGMGNPDQPRRTLLMVLELGVV